MIPALIFAGAAVALAWAGYFLVRIYIQARKDEQDSVSNECRNRYRGTGV